jgi:hypothetical protein
MKRDGGRDGAAGGGTVGDATGDAAVARPRRGLRRALAILLAVVVALIVVVAVALAVFHAGRCRAGEAAMAALASDDAVTVSTSAEGYAVFAGPDDDPTVTRGLVFYPGANVDAAAYAPLCHELAARGWLCVLVSMPLDLAILDVDAAGQVMAEYPQVERWYVGGHSMGGAMAASFAAGNPEGLAGLVLLAAYSTDDLTESGLAVYSAYGTEDGILNRANYERDEANLPSGWRELVIDGGNHAQFGDYGAQRGDGTATIAPEEQVDEAVSFIDQAA